MLILKSKQNLIKSCGHKCFGALHYISLTTILFFTDRERDFLKKVHDCVERGGKVLIPVFALGRVQELCILLDTYWDRMNLKVPVYFTMGLAETVSVHALVGKCV